MKKVILAILIIICVTALAILGVNYFKSDSETSTSTISSTVSNASSSASATNSKDASSDSKSTASASSKSGAADKSASKDKTPGGNAQIEIGKVSGTADSTVTVPVSVKTVPSNGIGSFNFNIKYDTSILEVVEVKPGDAFGSNNSNFDYTVIDTTGLVSFLYTSSNSGKDAITKPGVITNITFKVKKDAKKGATKITRGTAGAFGDVSLKKINPEFIDGEITVK
jgi:cytoskeletal protein RodZ